MLNLDSLESIINNFEKERKILNNILTEQSSTLFHSFDYYQGKFDVIEDILIMLKLYKQKFELEKKDKIIELMAEHLTSPVNSKKEVIEYFTKEVEDNENIYTKNEQSI